MTIIVEGANTKFVDGKLALGYFNVNFSAGTFPNNLNGNLQITGDQGVTIESTQAEVAAVAKTVILGLVNEDKGGAAN